MSLSVAGDIESVIAIVAGHFRATTEELRSPDRCHRVARARHVAMWVLAKQFNFTTREVGELFNRDHSSAGWSLRRLADELSVDPKLSREVEKVRAELGNTQGDTPKGRSPGGCV